MLRAIMTRSHFKFALYGFLVAAIVACANGQMPSTGNGATSTKTVAVTQIVEHLALNLQQFSDN